MTSGSLKRRWATDLEPTERTFEVFWAWTGFMWNDIFWQSDQDGNRKQIFPQRSCRSVRTVSGHWHPESSSASVCFPSNNTNLSVRRHVCSEAKTNVSDPWRLMGNVHTWSHEHLRRRGTCHSLDPLVSSCSHSVRGGGAASRRSVGTRNSLAQESGGQDDPKQTNETPSSSEGEKVEFPEIESVSIVPSSLFQPKRSHSILPLSGSTLRVRVPAECGRGGDVSAAAARACVCSWAIWLLFVWSACLTNEFMQKRSCWRRSNQLLFSA